jgi:PAS domain S-box-containing protein
MESSHHSSDLDPSSVLGFGAALPLLEAPEEVGRLLTGALRSMGVSDLQAVLLRGADGAPAQVVGSLGTRSLPAAVEEELRQCRCDLSFAGAEDGRPPRRQIDVDPDATPALAETGVRRLTVVRLATIDHDFGMVVAGRTDATTPSPVQASSLQMMAAQASMALHRIRLTRQRRQKAEALRASEARYRELYEHAPVAYVSVDAEGTIHVANERAAALLRTTTDSLVGNTLTHFCADADAAATTTEHLAACIEAQERVYDRPVRLCRADGDSIWVSLSLQPVEAAAGRAECLATMVDVTDRMEMERALRATRDELEERVEARTDELERANERLQAQAERLSILRDIDQAILAAESPTEIAAVAVRRAEQVVACERVSVTVLDWATETAEILAAGQDEEVLEAGTRVPLSEYYLPDALREGTAKVIPDLQALSLPPAAEKIRERGVRSVLCLPMRVEGELVGVLKMGRTRPNAFTAEDERVGQELADHLAIALRQARLWAAVQEQREQLATLRDIDQAILAAESPTEIAAEAIERARTLVPYESATVTVIDGDADRAHVLAAENNVLDAPTTLPLDEVYLSDALRAGETEVISDDAYAPVPEAESRIRDMGLRSILCLPMVVEDTVIGVIHVGRTEPNAFTPDDWQVGRELADHLAIALRQSQLLAEVQEQRERLEERVQERTAELESFTYSVSHDLRTPLRAIDGYTRILRDEHADRLDDDGRRLLETIHDSAQTMGRQIDDLLTLSRVGRRELNRASVDMEALAREVVDDLRRSAPGADVEAITVGPLPPALGDRSMIRHVFANLLSNALKFTAREDAPHVAVSGTPRDEAVVYRVADNGVGFDPDYADKMFGVFQRLHDDSEFEGTGVGLALVERILRRHDGEVWAEGAEGEGATISFTLPRPDRT